MRRIVSAAPGLPIAIPASGSIRPITSTAIRSSRRMNGRIVIRRAACCRRISSVSPPNTGCTTISAFAPASPARAGTAMPGRSTCPAPTALKPPAPARSSVRSGNSTPRNCRTFRALAALPARRFIRRFGPMASTLPANVLPLSGPGPAPFRSFLKLPPMSPRCRCSSAPRRGCCPAPSITTLCPMGCAGCCATCRFTPIGIVSGCSGA